MHRRDESCGVDNDFQFGLCCPDIAVILLILTIYSEVMTLKLLVSTKLPQAQLAGWVHGMGSQLTVTLCDTIIA